MLLHKKLSIAAVSAAALVTAGTIGAVPAEAALYKFSFTSEEANGYMIYDDSVSGLNERPDLTAYKDAIVEYKIDLGDLGVFEGTKGTWIVLASSSTSTDAIGDGLEFEVLPADREPESQYTLLSLFAYPRGAFGGSGALPTSVPSTATLEVFPYVDFPNTRGDLVFSGTVQTRIEKIPELTSVSALLGLGAWFILRRRRQTQPCMCKPNFGS